METLRAKHFIPLGRCFLWAFCWSNLNSTLKMITIVFKPSKSLEVCNMFDSTYSSIFQYLSFHCYCKFHTSKNPTISLLSFHVYILIIDKIDLSLVFAYMSHNLWYFRGLLNRPHTSQNNYNQCVRCPLGFDLSSQFINSNIELISCSSSCVWWNINFWHAMWLHNVSL